MRQPPHVLTTTRAVMAALGGTKAVALLTGRKYNAAANWLRPLPKKDQPQFPANTFVEINAALAAIGKSAPPSLWGMTDKQDDAA